MEKQKKITILMLHLLHGGVEKQTVLFANELVKKYDVEIISVYTMKSKPAYEIDERVKIKYLIDDAPNKNEFVDAVKHFNIVKILREGLKAKKILKLKKNLMIEEIKKLDCDYVLSTRIEYAEMLSDYAPEGVVTITQEHLHDDSEKYVSRVKHGFRNLDYLIVLGPGSRENYSKWLQDNKKTKIVEIPNILEKDSEDVSELDGHTMVSTGRMHPVKGFSDLLKVFKLVKDKVPDAKLNLIGGGDEYNKLQEEAKKLGIYNDVVMPGMVSTEEVTKYMLSSDLYVMTSLTECCPMVLLEASSCGLPLIAFDVPVGPKAMIRNDENGYLIENRNLEQMADKIVQLFDNKEKLVKMGRCAKEEVVKYLPQNIMEKWYDIFDKE